MVDAKRSAVKDVKMVDARNVDRFIVKIGGIRGARQGGGRERGAKR